MQDFQQFLSALLRGVDRLQQRTRADQPGGPVVRSPAGGPAAVGRDEIAIGIGKFVLPPDGAPWTGGICLNDKAAGTALKEAASHRPPGERAAGADMRESFSSVTDLVLNAPPRIFECWRAVVGDDASPAAFFGRFRLVVEDASPDSCFGLLCLLMRLAGIASDKIPNDWVDYIEGWEHGNIVVGEGIYNAYGCLHNALVHAKIDMETDDFGAAWVDGLRLMTEALASGRPPTALSLSISSAVFSRARALLRFEEQRYEESIERATCIQFLLPIADARNRYRLIDAYLAEQTLAMGSLKVFVRSDKMHPFLKNGFTLMAVYRTTAIGDGSDMTISVDQEASVELKELWSELEHAEDKAWGPARPHDAPRRGIVGYKDGKRADGSNAPEQPWFDGRDYSLLGSPKKLTDGRLGSKLNWDEVLEILWQTYHPFRHVRVLPGPAELVRDLDLRDRLKPIEDCYWETWPDGLEGGAQAPRLFVAGWYRADSSAPAFSVTPTFCKYLAACIRRSRTATPTGPVGLKELPDESAYDLLKLPGMIAVISTDGAFLVYDRQRFEPPLQEMKDEFARALKIRQRILQGGKDLELFLDDIEAFFTGRRQDLAGEDLLERLTRDQIEIAMELHEAHAAVVPHAARRFREAVLDRWGIQSWLDALARDISQIKNVLYGKAELDNARRVAFLHRFGVPIALAAVIYGFGVLENLWHLPPWTGVKWTGLLILLILSALIFGVMELGTAWRRRMRMKSIAAQASLFRRDPRAPR
jgi:hypothetical protein